MRYYCTVVSVLYRILIQAQPQKINITKTSPLATYSDEWNKPVYTKCNTAEKVTYMNEQEKEVIYILNLVRTYPKLFANSVLKKYPERTGNEQLLKDTYYFQSLMDTLLAMQPGSLLLPDNLCYTSAQCHAYQSGITGYDGHERKRADCRKKEYYDGECCDYGNDDPLEIILSLLIDEGVESLGHRSICLGDYEKIAVSIQPHKVWKFNTVLDFHY